MVRKINLVDVLADEFAGVAEPSESQVRAWTDDQIREYYRSGGRRPASAHPSTSTTDGVEGGLLLHPSRLAANAR